MMPSASSSAPMNCAASAIAWMDALVIVFVFFFLGIFRAIVAEPRAVIQIGAAFNALASNTRFLAIAGSPRLDFAAAFPALDVANPFFPVVVPRLTRVRAAGFMARHAVD